MAGELPPVPTKTTTPITDRIDPPEVERPRDLEASPDARLFTDEERRGAEISPHKIGRKALPARAISLFGAELAEFDRPIAAPKRWEQALANLLGGIFDNKGALADKERIEDYRTADAVAKAVAMPLAAPSDALGPITLFRPGLGNTAPGPAQIARLAQYTDKLVIAFANPGLGEEATLRKIDEIDGVKIPGNVWAIGSPKNLMITFEQASDLFLQQLETMRRAGLDLSESRATVVAHSQGGLDATLTRRRLNEAGFGNTFGKLITMATPFRGSPVSDETMAGLFTELGALATRRQAPRAINALDPHHVRRVITDADQGLVDISLIGQAQAGDDGKKDIRRFFKVSRVAIEASKSIASIFRGSDVRENDGLVTVASQLFGRLQHRLTKSYDHAGIAEDPFVADEIARLASR